LTPEHAIALIGNISTILRTLGSWPIGVTILLVVIGPWIAMFLLDRSQAKRFEKVVEMYEDNVELVKKFNQLAGSLQELVIINTQAITEITDTAQNNLFCPIARKWLKPRDIDSNELPIGGDGA